jgi:DNA-binding beta-propeller fold protein YncE
VRSLPDAGDPLLIRPVGLAVSDGRLYVSDSGDSVVRVFSTSGVDAGEIGRGVLGVPAYIACDPATSTVLVADRRLGAVLRFSTDGERLDDLVPLLEVTQDWEPLGVAADGEGAVAVTDTSGRHRMLVMDRAGTVAFSLGSAEGSSTPGNVAVALDYPNSVAFSGDEIWVSDSNNRRILVFDRAGAFQRFIPMSGIVRGITFLAQGESQDRYVAVVDALASEIVLLDEAGAEVTRYGAPGTSAGHLAYPNDIVYDAETEQLFVADTGNARVQVWKVAWPEAPGTSDFALDPLHLSPSQVFGALLAVMGCVGIAVVSWPRREVSEAAIVGDALSQPDT